MDSVASRKSGLAGRIHHNPAALQSQRSALVVDEPSACFRLPRGFSHNADYACSPRALLRSSSFRSRAVAAALQSRNGRPALVVGLHVVQFVRLNCKISKYVDLRGGKLIKTGCCSWKPAGPRLSGQVTHSRCSWISCQSSYLRLLICRPPP